MKLLLTILFLPVFVSAQKSPSISIVKNPSPQGSDVNIVMDAKAGSGWVTTISWTQIKGPKVPMSNYNQLNTWVLKPSNGDYTFRIRVVNNYLKYTLFDVVFKWPLKK